LSADDRLAACSGFTPEVSVISSDGAFGGFALQPTMADARSTLPFGASPGLLSWLPGDDRVRELALDGRELRSYPGEVHFLRVLPDGDFVTCGPVRPGLRERAIRRWSPGGSTPRELGLWTPPEGMRFDQPGVRPLDVDPLLRWLAYGWESGVYLRALGPSRGPVETLVGRHPGRLREVTFDPAGGRLASLDETGVVKVWSMRDRKELRSLPAVPAARFSMLSFDAVGRRLAWGTGGEGVLVWDLEGPPDAPPLTLRQGETAYGRQHAFSGDGRWLAGGGLRAVNFWALGQPHARVLRGHVEGPLQRLAFTGDSRFLVSCARDGARLWPLTPDGGRERLIPIGGDYMCYDVAIDPSGRGIALSSPFMGIYVVPLDGGEPRRLVNLAGRRLAVTAIAFDAGGRRLAVGSCYAPPTSELSLFVVDLRSGSYRTLPLRNGVPEDPYAGHVYDAVFSPRGRLLTAGDGGLKRWNLEDGTAKTVRGRPGRLGALAASGDRRRVLALLGRNVGDFVGLEDPEAVLLDAAAGESRPVPGRLHGARPTHALALDAAGERLAIGDMTGVVRVARVSADEPHLLLGHEAPVTDVAISPDGRWVASAAGSEIRLWPMPDVSRPPFHALPYDELMARLRALTNLEVAEDPTSATGYGIRIGPFPGWRDAPAW
jgi:WD40 repeat protein